ncbi:MAG: hypothetical protein KKD63_10055 [Proteobacteria bacterium]|nr:hypothetical protein [Pseudomonadota bacterium]
MGGINTSDDTLKKSLSMKSVSLLLIPPCATQDRQGDHFLSGVEGERGEAGKSL